jgi:hypothetical protein
MRRLNLLLVAGMFVAASVWADTPARPGTVNYVEGQVAMGGQALDSKSTGTELSENQSLATLTGKAEILLTPGVFLRLGPNTSLRMVAAGLTDTEVQLEQGRAMIEVDEIFRENHLRVLVGSFAIDLQKKGLYDFDAARNEVRVFDGEALIVENGRRIEIKGGHEVNLAMGADVKAHGFDKKAFEDDLYSWSRLRSSYLAEANVGQAQVYAGGAGFFGAGWYWNPWYSAYTFIPGDGFFYNPFGWGFYSPGYVYQAPFVGFYGGYRNFGHYAPPRGFVGGGYRGGYVGSGHYSSAPAFHTMGGGGFQGGFHGGHR